MEFLPPKEDDYRHVTEISRLFVSGAMFLHGMLAERQMISFEEWATWLAEDTSIEAGIATEERLQWLWDALRTEPELRDKFGRLPPSNAPWLADDQRRKVFDAGEWFIIGFKGGSVDDLLKRPERAISDEIVAVRTLGVLWMRSGKGGHLECCDCPAEVTIQAPEVFNPIREADIMEIDPQRISIGRNCVTVRVDSLNQAYTVASRRLEPHRRSHGGRIYDHLIHAGREKRTLLEEIRRQVEKGDWIVPDSGACTSARDSEPKPNPSIDPSLDDHPTCEP